MSRFFGHNKALFIKYWISVLLLLVPVFLILNVHLYREGVSYKYIIVENIIAFGLTPVTSWVALTLLSSGSPCTGRKNGQTKIG